MVREGGGDQRPGADGSVRVLHHARARNHVRAQGPLRPRRRRRRHHVDESVGAPARPAGCAVHPIASSHRIGARRRPQRCGVPCAHRCGLRRGSPRAVVRDSARRCRGARAAFRHGRQGSRFHVRRGGSRVGRRLRPPERRKHAVLPRRGDAGRRAAGERPENSPGVVARHGGADRDRAAARLARGVERVAPAAPPCRRRASHRSI